METTRLMSLCLALLLPVPATATRIRLEAENLPGAHTLRWRGKALNVRTVTVTKTSERLSFPICLYRQVSANITVRYSNDGGQDVVKVTVDGTQELSFSTEEAYGGGTYWNVFKLAVLSSPVTLKRGYHHLTLTFQSLDLYGIEIDYIDVSIDEDFITNDVLSCKLVIGAEPQFSPKQAANVNDAYIEQHSYRTACPEEDNVHLAVYHHSVKQYTLTATNPLYRTMYDRKEADTSTCPNVTFWRFVDVQVDNIVGNIASSTRLNGNINHTIISASPQQDDPDFQVQVSISYDLKVDNIVGNVASSTRPTGNIKHTTISASPLQDDPDFQVKVSISYDLKYFKTEFINADIHTQLKGKFTRNSAACSSSSNIKVTYVGRRGLETVLDEFSVFDSTVTKAWDIPEKTWSEDHRNFLNIYVSDREITLDKVELIRDYTGPDRPVDIYSSDDVLLQGFRNDFWWRRPMGESLTVKVGSTSIANLSRVALYVHVPWTVSRSFQQIFELYQDGNVRLAPVPYSSPVPNQWRPFGTSVIVGKSNPHDLRPAASIKTLTFDPKTFEMTLIYYDGSTSKLTLTYTVSETSLEVMDMAFSSSNKKLPFATFRSMFVDFGNMDSDSVQSNTGGPEHVLGAWSKLSGKEFLVFRSVESRHFTQSPDIRLTIRA